MTTLHDTAVKQHLPRCDSARTSLPFFFFNDTATTEIYTLSLHDALPILRVPLPTARAIEKSLSSTPPLAAMRTFEGLDRKSTRLNSSHVKISYAVFCLKKKKIMDRNLGERLLLGFGPPQPAGDPGPCVGI